MTNTIWKKINVGLGKETVRGTVVAPWLWTPKWTFDWDEKAEKIMDESAIGVIADAFEAHVVKKRAEGTLETNLYANVVWYLLLSVFGSVSSSVKETTAYQHDFAIAETNIHQSLTIAVADDVQDKSFPLAMVNSMTISSALGEFVKVSAEIRSKAPTDGALTPSYATDYPLLGKHVKFKLATNKAGLWAAPYITVKSVNLTISKNLVDDDVLGSVEPADFNNTLVGIEGDVELNRENETYLDLVNDGTKKAMLIEIIDANTTIGAVSNPTLKISLAKVVFTEIARSQGNGDIVKQTLSFKALYSTWDTEMIEAILYNTTTSY